MAEFKMVMFQVWNVAKILTHIKNENNADLIHALCRMDDKLFTFTKKSVMRIKGKY